MKKILGLHNMTVYLEIVLLLLMKSFSSFIITIRVVIDFKN